MRRQGKLLLPASLAGVAALMDSCAPEVQNPNVILIYADDVGYGDLGCNGETTVSTPNVDRLASEGVRFTNAHSTSATSTPSRFGMLTGMYPWRISGTGIAPGDAGMIIRPEMFTIADLMHNAGYRTGAVGKWHLGLGDKAGEQDWNGVIKPGLEDIGFDWSFIMAATADRVPCVYIENSKVVNLDPSDPIEVSYSAPFEGVPTGKSNPELLTKLRPSHGHDQAIVNGISRIGYMKGGESALWEDETIAVRIKDKAIQFMNESKDRPFFLYLGTNDIHVPRYPSLRFQGKSGMGLRGDAILQFDWTVGQVLDAIDSLGIADNTIVILTSDNGPVVDDGYMDQAEEFLGNHRPWGMLHPKGGKYSAFEAGTRVPMIVRCGKNVKKAGKPGSVSDALFSHIDFLASFAELLGVQVPEGAAKDSQPALARLLGTDNTGRPWIIEHNLANNLGIVAGDWKYIAPGRGPAYAPLTNTELGNSKKPQLYNLKDDITEENNIAELYPEVVREMDVLLRSIKENN
ncbi:MAG: arylsulfatase [Candidatus Cryptobacteroides sp.]